MRYCIDYYKYHSKLLKPWSDVILDKKKELTINLNPLIRQNIKTANCLQFVHSSNLQILLERHLPLKTTVVIGSGLPTFFLGRFLAASTTTRNMATKTKINESEKPNGKSLDRTVVFRPLPHHWSTQTGNTNVRMNIVCKYMSKSREDEGKRGRVTGV